MYNDLYSEFPINEEERNSKISQEIEEGISSVLFHSMIVSNLSYKIGKKLGLDENVCHDLAVAGILHDIGKIHLNCKLIRKNKNLSAEENLGMDDIRYVRNHSIDSYKILKEYGYSEYILETVLYHHENYDGTGYPDGLNGNDIPQGARILRVCDVFAALVDTRIYRAALDIDSAVETMIDEVKNYDMQIFLAFQKIIHEDEMADFFEWIVEHNIEVSKREEARKLEKKKENRRRRIAKLLK